MNVLIAVDFSEVTRAVLEAATTFVARPDGVQRHFYLIHVAEPDPSFVGWEAGPEVVRDQVAAEFHREHQELAKLAETLRGHGAEVVTPLLVQGPIVETILHQSRKLEARLLVVGSHGHGKTFDVLVGSVSAALIRRSTTPVLVVPAADHG